MRFITGLTVEWKFITSYWSMAGPRGRATLNGHNNTQNNLQGSQAEISQFFFFFSVKSYFTLCHCWPLLGNLLLKLNIYFLNEKKYHFIEHICFLRSFFWLDRISQFVICTCLVMLFQLEIWHLATIIVLRRRKKYLMPRKLLGVGILKRMPVMYLSNFSVALKMSLCCVSCKLPPCR